MHSVEENGNNDNMPDEDRKRNPSKQSNATNSMGDVIMGSSSGSYGNSREPQQVTVDAETLVSSNSRQNVESFEKALSV